jgi:hypothetical protein
MNSPRAASHATPNVPRLKNTNLPRPLNPGWSKETPAFRDKQLRFRVTTDFLALALNASFRRRAALSSAYNARFAAGSVQANCCCLVAARSRAHNARFAARSVQTNCTCRGAALWTTAGSPRSAAVAVTATLRRIAALGTTGDFPAGTGAFFSLLPQRGRLQTKYRQ